MSPRPLPPAIYWKRRLLVLAGIILLAWIVVQLWPSAADESTAEPDPTPSETAASAAASDESEVEKDLKNGGAVPVAFEQSAKSCDPEDVVVSPSVPDGQHAGEDITIQLTVSNSAGKPCEFDPQRAELLAVIGSNDEAVWDSTVCESALLDKNVKIPADFGAVVDVTWSGRGSGSNCGKDNDYAGTGKYDLKIATLGGEPGKTRFSLSAQPEKDESGKDESGKDESDKAKPADG